MKKCEDCEHYIDKQEEKFFRIIAFCVPEKEVLVPFLERGGYGTGKCGEEGKLFEQKRTWNPIKSFLIAVYTFMGTVQIIIGIQRRDYWCAIIGAWFILICLFLAWQDGKRKGEARL